MATSGSKLPPQTQTGQQIQTPRTQERSVEGVRPDTGSKAQQQAKTPTDQFAKKTVNKVIHQMKEGVQKGGKALSGRMLQAGKTSGPPAVLTEELRAEFRQVSGATADSDLSDFEKVFLEYFMGESTLGAMLAAGEKKYRKKQLQQWKEFFEILYACVKEKECAPDQISKLIFRAISNQDPRPSEFAAGPATARPSAASKRRSEGVAASPAVNVLVADLYLKRERRDRCEKFVRLDIPTQEALIIFQKLSPGDVISVGTLVECFGSGDIPYLSLYYKPVREGLMTAQGHPLANGLQQQAGAAARASEAMHRGSMDVSSKAANLAKHHVKGKGDEKLKENKEPDSDSDLYKQKNLLDKLLS